MTRLAGNARLEPDDRPFRRKIRRVAGKAAADLGRCDRSTACALERVAASLYATGLNPKGRLGGRDIESADRVEPAEMTLVEAVLLGSHIDLAQLAGAECPTSGLETVSLP